MKHTVYGTDYFKNIVVAFLACATLILLPCAAYAQAMGTAICNVLCIVQGQMGTGMAILGICAVSGAAILGKGSWGMVFTIVAGVGIMFGADTFAGILGLGSAGCGC